MIHREQHPRSNPGNSCQERCQRQHRLEGRFHTRPKRQQTDHVGCPSGAAGRQDAHRTPHPTRAFVGPCCVERERKTGVNAGNTDDCRKQKKIMVVSLTDTRKD